MLRRHQPFVLDHYLGRGAFGVVHRGRLQPGGEVVAVKILAAPRSAHAPSRAAFAREVRAMARLDHPAVATIFDTGELVSALGDLAPAGAPWMALRLGTASVAENPPDAWPALAQMIDAALRGLGHAHARGLVHRDLKPSNILVSDAGYFLSDFGLAHALAEEETANSHAELERAGLLDASAGTLTFMAPEQLAGQWRDFGPGTDLWALGATIWEVATGQRLFVGESFVEVARAHERLAGRRFEPRFAVAEGLEGWLRTLLSQAIGARPRCAAHARRAFETIAAGPLTGAASKRTLATRTSPQDTLLDTCIDASELRADLVALARGAPRVSAVPQLTGVAGIGLFGLRDTPLVGRVEARAALLEIVADTQRDGQTRAVVLRGPCGTGKSRLARWLLEQSHTSGLAPHGLKVLGSELASRALPRCLGASLGCTGLGGEELVERLASILGLRSRARDVAAWLQPNARGRMLSTDAERFQAASAACRAAGLDLVWLDDAQWDTDALRLVQHALRDGTLPVVFVLTVDDDRVEDALAASLVDAIAEAPNGAVMAVGGLDRAACRAAVERRIALGEGLRERLLEHCADDVNFALQLVSFWVGSDALRAAADGRGALVAEADAGAWPETLDELWVRRLSGALDHQRADRAAAKAALEVAVALGEEVDETLWRTAVAVRLGIDAEASASICDALALALLRGGLALDRTGGWTAVHPSLRQALAAALSPDALRLAHEACAAAASASERLPALVRLERIYRHRLGAGAVRDAAEALADWIVAIERMLGFQAARSLVVRLCELVDGVAVAADDPLQATAAYFAAWRHYVSGEVTEAEALIVPMVAKAETHGWREERIWLFRMLGVLAMTESQHEKAVSAHRSAIEAARDVGDARSEAVGRMGVAAALRWLGRYRDARDELVRAVELAVSVGDPMLEGEGRAGVATLADIVGDMPLARAESARALALLDGVGGRVRYLGALLTAAEIARHDGDLDEARELYLRALAEATDAQRIDYQRTVRLNLCACALQMGDDAFAELHLDAVDSFDGAPGQGYLQPFRAWLRAALTARRGALATARAALEDYRAAFADGGAMLEPDIALLQDMCAAAAAELDPGLSEALAAMATDVRTRITEATPSG